MARFQHRLIGKRKTAHNKKDEFRGYPWEPGSAEIDLSAVGMHQSALAHQITAYDAALKGVPGSAYPLPPPSGGAPEAAVLMGKRNNNPAYANVREPIKQGRFVETTPGQLTADTGYVSVTKWPGYEAQDSTDLTAQVSQTTNHLSQSQPAAPQYGQTQKWDLATAKAEYASSQLTQAQLSRSAAAGGIRGTLRPAPSDAGRWGVPLRVTPGVPARTYPRINPVAPASQGTVLLQPAGAQHPLYGA